MRRSLALFLALFAVPAMTQTQPSFDAQIAAAHPSLRLDFDDATIRFRDQVSGLAFLPSSVANLPNPQDSWSLNGTLADSAGGNALTLHGGASLAGPGWFPGSLSIGNGNYATAANTGTFTPSGTARWSSTFWLNDYYSNGWPVQPILSTRDSSARGLFIGQINGQIQVYLGDGTGGSITVHTASGTPFPNNTLPVAVTVAFDGSNHASGVAVGWGGVSMPMVVDSDTLSGSAVSGVPVSFGADPGTGYIAYYGGGLISDVRFYSVTLSSSDIATLVRNGMYQPSAVGTILAQQSGFDALTPGNKAASFTAEAYLVAPNNTLGNYEWNVPFSIHMTVDNPPASGEVLASKGATPTDQYNGIGWALTWSGSSVVFTENAHGTTNKQINASSPSLPSGVPLDIYVTSDGTGTYAGLNLYVNGTAAFSHGGTNFVSGDTIVDATPLYIAGTLEHGGGGSAIKIDEFDMFPGVVAPETYEGTFVQMHWYQALLGPKPTVSTKLILSDDGCADMDNIYAIELAIAAEKLGYLRLVAIASTADDEGFYRALLDSAGLNHVPLVRPTRAVGGNSPVCNADITIPAYNASIDRNYSDLPDAATVYRRIFAGLAPGEKVAMVYGGPYTDLAQFMQSTADSISPLTGLQLFESSVQLVNFQGGSPPTGTIAAPNPSWEGNGEEDSEAAEYVATHNGAVPLNWYGGSPQSPSGSLHTRMHTDPLWLTENINGTDMRTCWDCLPVTGLLTNAFRGDAVEGQMVYGDARVGAGEYVSSKSNQWFYPLSPLSTPGGSAYTWFLNSLINPVPQGPPRGVN